MAEGVSKDCIFDEDFKYVFKTAVGAVICEIPNRCGRVKAIDSDDAGTDSNCTAKWPNHAT